MAVTKYNWSYAYCALVDATVALRNPFVKESLNSTDREMLEDMLDALNATKARIVAQIDVEIQDKD